MHITWAVYISILTPGWVSPVNHELGRPAASFCQTERPLMMQEPGHLGQWQSCILEVARRRNFEKVRPGSFMHGARGTLLSPWGLPLRPTESREGEIGKREEKLRCTRKDTVLKMACNTSLRKKGLGSKSACWTHRGFFFFSGFSKEVSFNQESKTQIRTKPKHACTSYSDPMHKIILEKFPWRRWKRVYGCLPKFKYRCETVAC